MPPRGRRSLTREERALWDRVVATASTLKPGETSLPAAPPPRPVKTPKPSAVGSPQPVMPRPAPPAISVDLSPDPHAGLRGRAPRMDRGRYEKLRRGRLEPEARLDLHGMTAERAHAALTRFVLSAHAEGLRLVLVITGKGRDGAEHVIAPHRHGILRHSVPHWLAAPPLVTRVLDLAPAHQRHGGGGAYYIYLRRQR
jgi:DNA-nicking Smr family endonuclease